MLCNTLHGFSVYFHLAAVGVSGGEGSAMWYLFGHVTVILMQFRTVGCLTESREGMSAVKLFALCCQKFRISENIGKYW